MRFKLLMVLLVSSFFVVSAQTATTAKIVEYSRGSASFTVELKGCVKNNDASYNVICNFVWTNKSATDFGFDGYRVADFFKAYDSAGTSISINVAKKGNNDWNNYFTAIFASQLPTPVRIEFKLPTEDTVVTILDLMGDKVTRWAQLPITNP